jgi:hypothetical protein
MNSTQDTSIVELQCHAEALAVAKAIEMRIDLLLLFNTNKANTERLILEKVATRMTPQLYALAAKERKEHTV